MGATTISQVTLSLTKKRDIIHNRTQHILYEECHVFSGIFSVVLKSAIVANALAPKRNRIWRHSTETEVVPAQTGSDQPFLQKHLNAIAKCAVKQLLTLANFLLVITSSIKQRGYANPTYLCNLRQHNINRNHHINVESSKVVKASTAALWL